MMIGNRFRLAGRTAVALALTTCSVFAASDLRAQNFIALIEQEEGPMVVRLVDCGTACKVMRFDDSQGANSMFIEVRMFEGGVLDGRFSFVDHAAKKIDVLSFSDPALADYIFGAQATRSNALEALMDALLGQSEIQATGERQTFTVRDFDSGDDIELDAEKYTFDFEYEMEALPGLAQMSPEERAQMPDIKLHMTTTGETWVAPDAPGADDLAQFYLAMGTALHQYTRALAGDSGEQADMTASMVSNMAGLAALGLPVRTTTSVEMRPVVGGAGGAMAEMFTRMMRLPEIPPTTSQVMGLGTDPATAFDLDFSNALEWGWRTEAPNGGSAYDSEGYEIRELVPETASLNYKVLDITSE